MHLQSLLIAALAALAAASEPPCRRGTYRCSGFRGVNFCNKDREWQVSPFQPI